MATELHIFLITYGFLSLTHLGIQYYFAHRHRAKGRDYGRDYTTRVAVLVPIYNECPWRLRRCIRSLIDQSHRHLHILLIDDGTKDLRKLEWVYREFAVYQNVQIEYLPRNMGKREAQHQGFLRHADFDLYATVDSDTVLDRDAIAVMAARFSDSSIGAVTGDIGVDNWKRNWLTRLIKMRYWSAFHVERAAQSYFSALMCCSGPLSMYRGPVLQSVWESYITQTFLGRRCTFGDDRHLTNLILREKYKAVFEPNALAKTHVPERIFWDYIKQQWRWNMSFYREMLWNIRYLRHHHLFMTYDLAMQLILPFMLLGGLLITLALAFGGYPRVSLWYGLTALAMGFIRSLYGMWCTRDRGFLIFTIYGLLHVVVLIPLRVYSLITLFARRTSWGTR